MIQEHLICDVTPPPHTPRQPQGPFFVFFLHILHSQTTSVQVWINLAFIGRFYEFNSKTNEFQNFFGPSYLKR